MRASGERRLVLIRHSLPEIEPAVHGTEWRLSRDGRARSRTLAARLAACGLVRVVSSTEPKAIETARIVARELCIPWGTAEGLHEHDRSNVVGLDRARFHDVMARLFARPDDLVFGAETAAQARQRFSTSLCGVLERHPDGGIAVVTHGTVLSLYLAGRAGWDAFALWQRLGLPCYAVLSRPALRVLEIVESMVSPEEETDAR